MSRGENCQHVKWPQRSAKRGPSICEVIPHVLAVTNDQLWPKGFKPQPSEYTMIIAPRNESNTIGSSQLISFREPMGRGDYRTRGETEKEEEKLLWNENVSFLQTNWHLSGKAYKHRSRVSKKLGVFGIAHVYEPWKQMKKGSQGRYGCASCVYVSTCCWERALQIILDHLAIILVRLGRYSLHVIRCSFLFNT